MSYEYTIDPENFSVEITGDNYRARIPHNPATGAPWVDATEAEAYAEAFISQLGASSAGRQIRVDQFMDRIHVMTEQVRIEVSTDPVVKVFEKILYNRPKVNLDHPLAIQGIEYLRDHTVPGDGPYAGQYYLDGATEEERAARATEILS